MQPQRQVASNKPTDLSYESFAMTIHITITISGYYYYYLSWNLKQGYTLQCWRLDSIKGSHILQSDMLPLDQCNLTPFLTAPMSHGGLSRNQAQVAQNRAQRLNDCTAATLQVTTETLAFHVHTGHNNKQCNYCWAINLPWCPKTQHSTYPLCSNQADQEICRCFREQILLQQSSTAVRQSSIFYIHQLRCNEKHDNYKSSESPL